MRVINFLILLAFLPFCLILDFVALLFGLIILAINYCFFLYTRNPEGLQEVSYLFYQETLTQHWVDQAKEILFHHPENYE